MPRLRLKSSFIVANTAAMSSFSSSRLMMSSTRAALMLTLAVWLLAFASEGRKGGKKERGRREERREGLKLFYRWWRNERSRLHAGRSSVPLHMKARREEIPILSCGHSTEAKQALQLERRDSLPEQRLDPKLTLPDSPLKCLEQRDECYGCYTYLYFSS